MSETEQGAPVGTAVHPASVPQLLPLRQRRWTAGAITYGFGGLATLFLWLLLGDFVWSMHDRSVGPMCQWYLNHLNVPNIVFGLLVNSLPALIGVVVTPIISVRSDRHRGPWGRRIPFLLVTTPLATLGMLGLAATPLVSSHLHSLFPRAGETLIAIGSFAIFWTLFEVAALASLALFNGLVNDVVPRAMLGRFYGLFRAVSLVDGMIFNYWIMGKVPGHFSQILVVIGLVYGAAFLLVCLKVREGAYPPVPPEPPKTSPIDGIRQYIRECYSNPYYRGVFVMLVASGLAFAPVNIFSIPYARSLGVEMDLYGKCISLTFFISLCLSYPLGWLADMVHPLRMLLATLACHIIVTLSGFFLISTPHSFLVAWISHGVLAGCFYTGTASLALRLFPQERFAQFASAAGIIGAPAGILLAPLVGMLIDTSGNAYRVTFLAGTILSGLALLAAWKVHGRFLLLGGPRNYQAP